MIARTLLTACVALATTATSAQTVTLRYANDYFAATDYYFTQGTYLGLDGERWGVFVGQEGFTPTDLSDPNIRPLDRPYAGTFYVGARARRGAFTYDALLGVIGPAALGEEQQSGIHRAIDDEIPQGWRHQIRNGLLLDVGVGFRQNLLHRRHFATDVEAEGRVGTFKTRLSAGAEVRAGWPWLVGFATARTAVPLHDASLQGALLSRARPHAFDFGEVRRLVGRAQLGFRVRLGGRFVFNYARTFATREFDGARRHGWGEVGITLLATARRHGSLIKEAWGEDFRRW